MQRGIPGPRRFATFNFCLTPCWPWQVRSGHARVQAFADTFLAEGNAPDAWMFQEVWDVLGGVSCSRRWSAVVERAMRPRGYKWFAVSRVEGRPCLWAANPGLMIASRIPIVDSGSYTFRNSSGLQRWLPHGALWARLSDGTLLVSTHMHAPTEDTWLCNSARTAHRVQQAQLLELLDLLGRLSPGGAQHSVIVGGDFNMEREDLEPLVSRCRRPFAIVPNSMPTYPYPRDGRSPLVNAKFAYRDCCVDHFLVSAEVAPNAVAALPCASCVAAVSRVGPLPPLWISDHAALFLELDLQVG